jgi:thiol-activated cytolysin
VTDGLVIMTAEDSDDRCTDRRRFLATLGGLGAVSLAGCSVQTPAGEFGFQTGGDSTPNPTPSPTPVETTRPPSSTSSPTPSPTDSPTPSPTDSPTPSPTDSPTPSPTPDGQLDVDPGTLEPVQVEPIDPTLADDVTVDATEVGTLDPEVVAAATDDSGPGTPSGTTSATGGIEVAVTPGSRSTGRQSLGSRRKDSANDMVCSTQEQAATAGGGGLLTENLVLNHRLNELWPGAIIPAKSVANGGYGPALSPNRLPNRQPPAVRNPVTVTLFTDANRYSSGNPNVSQVVDPPTSDGVEQARVELLQDVQDGTSAAQLSFDVRQVHSEKHLDVQLGVDYNSLGTSVSGDFSYSRDSVTNKLLAKVFQVYYLMGVTFPNPDGSFVTDPSVLRRNDLLISDVSFGRLLLFSAESKHTVQDIEASLDATFRGLAGSGSGSLDVKHKRVLDETRIRGQAIGGGATSAAQLISDFGENGLSRLRNYVVDGANYGPNNPGAPIGFTGRYLSTLDRANTYLTTEYTARSCYPKTRKFRVHNMQLEVKNAGGDGGGNLKLYGDITVVPRHPDDTYVARVGNAWSRDRDEFVKIDEDSSKTLVNVDETVEFTVGEDRTWTEYMDEAAIEVSAELRERDNLSNDEYKGDTEVGRWKPTDPVDRTPTIVFSEENNVTHLTFDVSPVPIQ